MVTQAIRRYLTIGNYGYYQTLQEEDALEIALRESKEMYQIDKEATDLALALELSLIEDKQDIIDRCSESGIPWFQLRLS